MPKADESFQPRPVNVGKTPTYKVDYKLGIMINYEVLKEAVAPYVPKPLTPIPIRILQTDKDPKYYVSLYLAVCGMNDHPQESRRADVFTYVKDATGLPGMLFLSVLCDIPAGLPKAHVPKFITMQESFFVDSDTGKCTVPHQVIDSLTMSRDGVCLEMGDTRFESTFKVKNTSLFHNDFVVANSQIFHNGKDRTINYFNQEFISAPIADIDLASVRHVTPSKFHALCSDRKLDSVQVYGDASNPITWYFKSRM